MRKTENIAKLTFAMFLCIMQRVHSIKCGTYNKCMLTWYLQYVSDKSSNGNCQTQMHFFVYTVQVQVLYVGKIFDMQ